MKTPRTKRTARSTPRRRVLLVAILICALSALAMPAFAATPTGEFARFGDCPLAVPQLSVCLSAQTTGGQLQLGTLIVPIAMPITLQGGVLENEGNLTTFVAPPDGHVLSQAAEEVPGGLFGLNGHDDHDSGRLDRFDRLSVTPELAGPAAFNIGDLLSTTGVGLTLPLKLKLANPLVGRHCFIGANATPLTLRLTTGMTSPPPLNAPISGSLGTLGANAESTILSVTGSALVDNAFTAPAAQGCGFLDRIIDHRMHLPAPAGSNAATLDMTEQYTAAQSVRDHEH
jgi:hypothetical protein